MIKDRLEQIGSNPLKEIFYFRGEGTVNLAVGEPDFSPPTSVLDTLRELKGSEVHRYGDPQGLMALRSAILEFMDDAPDHFDEGNVVITCGATEALASSILAHFDPGDELLIPDPGFILFNALPTVFNITPITYPLHFDNGFEIDVNDLESMLTERTRGILLNYPSNPTGAVLGEDKVRAVLEFAEEHDLKVISDEVYHRFVYDADHSSPLSRYHGVIHVNSFSKTFALTGWRLGFTMAERELIDPIKIVHQYLVTSPSTILQHAAVQALTSSGNYLRSFVEEMRWRRDYAHQRLTEMGLDTLSPAGAFYAFPSVKDLGGDSLKISKHLIEHGVLTAPGVAFGPGGEGHIRISFAASRDSLEAGLDAMENGLRELR